MKTTFAADVFLIVFFSFPILSMETSNQQANKVPAGQFKTTDTSTIRDEANNDNSLDPSSKLSHFEIPLLLITSGADPEIQNTKGETLLFMAAYEGSLDYVRLLFEIGGNINAQNNIGETPLHAAVTCGNNKLIKWLINHGADKNARNHKGNTPLHKVVSCSNSIKPKCLDIIEWLITHGAKCTIPDGRGRKIGSNFDLDYDFLHQYPLLKAVISDDRDTATSVLNSYPAPEQLEKKRIVELNRALILAAAIGQDIMKTILSHFSMQILPDTLAKTLTATAAHGNLPFFISLYHQLRNILFQRQFAAALAKALYWAVVNQQEPTLKFLLEHAFVLGQAPNVIVHKTAKYITSILKTQANLPAQARKVLTNTHDSLTTITKIRKAVGQQGLTEQGIYALNNKMDLPTELFAHVLHFALSPLLSQSQFKP